MVTHNPHAKPCRPSVRGRNRLRLRDRRIHIANGVTHHWRLAPKRVREFVGT